MFIQIQAEDLRGDDRELIINTNQIAFVTENFIHMGNRASFKVDEKTLKDILLVILPKERRQKNNKPDGELLELFEELHRLTGGKGRVVFTLKREKQLKDLLGKHRLTKEDLIRAARNIGNDDWLQGDNDRRKRYGDVDYLLRPDKAAKWSEEQPEKKLGMF